MKKNVLFLAFFLMVLSVFSQEEKTEKIKKIKYEFAFELSFFEPLHTTYYSYYPYINSSVETENPFFFQSLSLNNGVRFNNGLYLGISTGTEFLNVQTLPLLAEIKYDLTKNSLTPYLQGQLGYSIALNNSRFENNSSDIYWDGGLLGSVGIGIKKKFKQSALSFGLNYRRQHLFYNVDYNPDNGTFYEETHYIMNRLVFKMSLSFE